MSNQPRNQTQSGARQPPTISPSSTRVRSSDFYGRAPTTLSDNGLPAQTALSFGKVLKLLRTAIPLTQKELASKAGLSERGISDLERGVNRKPQQETLRVLAEALGLAPDRRALFDRAGNQGMIGADMLTALLATLPPLVGRASELELLKHHLLGEGPPVLLFAGEPGIGKTRLLDEAERLAPQMGWQVLRGGCIRRSGQEPYAPFVRLLARFLERRLSAEQRTDLQGCAWLVRLLPELAELRVVPGPEWKVPPDHERRLMFGAVRRFLANVSGPAGTLLLLDDLQWAGSDALDLFADLMLSPAQRPLRVIATYRDTEVRPEDPLATVLADLAGKGLLARHALDPLSPQEALALAETFLARLPHPVGTEQTNLARLARLVAYRAGGVPFFIESLVHVSAVHTAGDDAGTENSWEVPWDVGESIRQRVALLSSDAQALLRIASVAGREISRALLLGMAGGIAMPEEILADSLEALDRARLLVALKGAEAYQFAHDLVREVIVADLSEVRRQALHRRLAEMIERLPPSEQRAAEMAWHFRESGEANRVLPYALLAGDQAAAIYALADAERHYGIALKLARHIGDQVYVAETLMRLARMFLSTARYGDAFANLQEAAVVYRALDDSRGMEWVAAQRVLLDALADRSEQAGENTRCALESLAVSTTPRHVVEVCAAILNHYHVTGRHREIIPFVANLITSLTRSCQDGSLQGQYLPAAGYSLLFVGSTAAALSTAEEAIPLCEAAGDLSSLVQLLHLASFVHTYGGAFVSGQRYIAQACEAAGRLGELFGIAFTASAHAHVAFYCGEWDDAKERADHSVHVGRRTDFSRPTLYPLIEQGRMRMAGGAIGQARESLNEAMAVAEFPHEIPALPWVHGLLAECDLAEGNAPAARDRLRSLTESFALVELGMSVIVPTLVEAQIELGEWAAADELLTRVVECAHGRGERVTLVDLLRVRAQLRLRQARWHDAREAVEESLAFCHAMPYPYAEAKALYVYGQLHAAEGEPELAREQYQAAIAICARLGEGLYRPHIECALASLDPPAVTP
jgi:transcriptional regulator with XRE-family HTH domain/tetratricopeptide (TPR) repeat protein